MGFYGNLTSSTKTNLQIDMHYSNRATMDKDCLNDGVYAGRYVLIEYDLDTHLNQLYLNSTDGFCYWDTAFSLRYRNDGTDNGVLYRVITNINYNESEIWVGDSSKPVGLRRATKAENANNAYLSNYLKDRDTYGNIGQGYDSTIWQKIYENGTPNYVNIASLNSVVPSFKIKADAPSQTPIPPYFGKTSTNILYNLHIQPTWGFRVAEAGQNDSDESTQHDDKGQVRGAIYYNKKGFEEYQPNTKDNTKQNYIKLEPGKSGQKYYDSADSEDPEDLKEALDIQEFKLSLPAIGNMVASGWDVIHGPNRDDDKATSLQGRLDFFTKEIMNNEIPVQTAQGGNLVGAKTLGDAWISPIVNAANKTISITHLFTAKADTTTSSDINNSGDTINLYSPQVDERGHVVGKNTETVTLPYGFKTITPGSSSNEITNGTENTAKIIANNTKDNLNVAPSNKWINVSGNDNTNTLTIGHEVNTITTTAKSDTNLDGIGEFIVQDLVFDNAGHVTANQPHKYTLPYNFRNIVIGEGSNVIAGGSHKSGTIEADQYNDTFIINSYNRWITISADTNTDAISIGHAAAGNEATTVGDTLNKEPKFGETFTVPYVKYDEMGHIKSNGTRTITIPKGSLTNPAPSGNTSIVLTSLDFTPETGALVKNERHVGTLLLTNYTSVNNNSEYVQAIDSINQAFNKIDTRLDKEIKRAALAEKSNADAISNESSRALEAEEALGKRIDLLVNDMDPNDLDSIVDFVNWTTEHGLEVAEMVQAIDTNSKAIEDETKRAEEQEKLIREEFAAADEKIGEAVTAVSDLVGETKVSQQIDDKLIGYYTKNEVDNEFANYYTSTEIDTKIANYYNKEEIDNQFIGYYTSNQVDAKLDAINGQFENYYNKGEIDTQFEKYETAEVINNKFSEVSNQFNNYYAKDEIDQSLEQYSLTSEIEQLYALKNEVVLDNEELTIISKNTEPETLTGTLNDILTNLLTRIILLENPENSIYKGKLILTALDNPNAEIKLGEEYSINYKIEAEDANRNDTDVNLILAVNENQILTNIQKSGEYTIKVNDYFNEEAGLNTVILIASHGGFSETLTWNITTIQEENGEEPPIEE